MIVKKPFAGFTLFGVSAGISLALILNLCDAVFACGCKSAWNGGAEQCNVHQHGVHHCPWCSVGTEGFWLAMVLLLIPQLVFSFWPAGWAWRVRIPVVLAMFPIAGGLVGLGYGWYLGYWR
jgi:hypothetical protein